MRFLERKCLSRPCHGFLCVKTKRVTSQVINVRRWVSPGEALIFLLGLRKRGVVKGRRRGDQAAQSATPLKLYLLLSGTEIPTDPGVYTMSWVETNKIIRYEQLPFRQRRFFITYSANKGLLAVDNKLALLSFKGDVTYLPVQYPRRFQRALHPRRGGDLLALKTTLSVTLLVL